MNRPTGSTRGKALLGPYLLWGLGVGLVGTAAVIGKDALGAAVGWVGVPVLLVVAAGVFRKMLSDSDNRPPSVKWAILAAGSVMLAGLFAAFSFLVTASINPFNAVLVSGAVVFCGGWVLVGLLGAARWVLGRQNAVLSVARHVIDEALGLRVVNGFMVIFMLLIPALLFAQLPDQPVRYRIQTFLSYGLGLSGVVLSLFVLLFGAWTITSELRDRQAQVSLVKPLGRGAFVLGKWLGLVVLSGLMLTVAGLTVYLFTVFYLAALPPTDAMDATAVKQEVLTARVSCKPKPPDDLVARVNKRMEQMLATEDGRAMIVDRGGSAAVRNEFMQQELSKWRSLGPLEKSDRWKQDYYFDGLERAAQIGGAVSLRFKIKVSGQWGVKTPLRVILNDGQAKWDFDSALDMVENIPISTRFIDATGRLKVTMVNLSRDLSVIFPDKHLELLYTVDRFGPNFVRAVAVMWIKLAFLASVAVVLSTFLGFAVSALGGVLVYLVTSLSAFILDAAQSFVLDPKLHGQAAQWSAAAVRAINEAVAWVFGVFGQYRPITMLAEARYISWEHLLGCLLWIGVMWAVPLGLLAWLIFQRRELARVQV